MTQLLLIVSSLSEAFFSLPRVNAQIGAVYASLKRSLTCMSVFKTVIYLKVIIGRFTIEIPDLRRIDQPLYMCKVLWPDDQIINLRLWK